MLALFAAALQSPSRIETFAIDGVERQALVFPGAGPAPHPLVLAFHGHGGGMRQAARSFAVQTAWPEATVVYPQGLPSKGMTDPDGTKNGWQQNAGEMDDRDLKFVDRILADTKDVDARRVYAMGHSNGGRFTYVLWGARGDRFAAYGPSSSPGVLAVRGAKPASAFIVGGEADPIIRFPIQRMTMQAVARLDGANLAAGKKDGYVTLAPGRDGTEVGTYIHPGDHTFAGASVVPMVALFKRHSR